MMPMRLFVAAVCLAFAGPACLVGQTFNWVGGTGSNWTEPLNWNGNAAPTPGPDVVLQFGAGANGFVMVNDYTNPDWNRLVFADTGYSLSGNAMRFVQSSNSVLPSVAGFGGTTVTTDWVLDDELFYTGSAATESFLYGGTISGSSGLNLFGGFTLDSGGAINNTGAINIDSNSGTVTVNGTIGTGGLMTIANNRTLSGTGTINRDIAMPGAADFSSQGTLTVNGNIAITNSPNNLLSGTLAVNGLVDVKGGTFQQSAGTVLSGNGNLRLASGGGATLDGTVSSTRTVELTGLLFPCFISGSGTIEGNVTVDGGHFVVGNLTLGQNLTFSNSGNLAFLGTSSDTLTINGLTTVSGSASVRLEGTVAGTGSMLLESGGTMQMAGLLNQDLIVRGQLDGVSGSQFSNSVTTEAAILIGLLDLQNTLNVQTAGVTQLVAGSSLSVLGLTAINTGVLEISDSSVFNANGDVSVFGGGTLNVNGNVNGNLQLDSTAFLTGAGRVVGDVDLDGTLGPGNSAGILEVEGSIILTPTSTVCIEIGGTTPGLEYDVVDGRSVSNIELGNSTLELSLFGGFVPVDTDQFNFLVNFASITGQFGNSSGDGDSSQSGSRIHFAGGSFGITYGSNSVYLSDFRAVPEPGGLFVCVVLASWFVGRRNRQVRLDKALNSSGYFRKSP